MMNNRALVISFLVLVSFTPLVYGVTDDAETYVNEAGTYAYIACNYARRAYEADKLGNIKSNALRAMEAAREAQSFAKRAQAQAAVEGLSDTRKYAKKAHKEAKKAYKYAQKAFKARRKERAHEFAEKAILHATSAASAVVEAEEAIPPAYKGDDE